MSFIHDNELYTQEMSCSSKSLNDLKIFVRERERERQRDRERERERDREEVEEIDLAYNEMSQERETTKQTIE
jgi:hypothetical protein